MGSTEPSNLQGVIIKENKMFCTEIDIEVPGIKKECFDPSERIHQTAGKPNFLIVFL